MKTTLSSHWGMHAAFPSMFFLVVLFYCAYILRPFSLFNSLLSKRSSLASFFIHKKRHLFRCLSHCLATSLGFRVVFFGVVPLVDCSTMLPMKHLRKQPFRLTGACTLLPFDVFSCCSFLSCSYFT